MERHAGQQGGMKVVCVSACMAGEKMDAAAVATVALMEVSFGSGSKSKQQLCIGYQRKRGPWAGVRAPMYP